MSPRRRPLGSSYKSENKCLKIKKTANLILCHVVFAKWAIYRNLWTVCVRECVCVCVSGVKIDTAGTGWRSQEVSVTGSELLPGSGQVTSIMNQRPRRVTSGPSWRRKKRKHSENTSTATPPPSAQPARLKVASYDAMFFTSQDPCPGFLWTCSNPEYQSSASAKNWLKSMNGNTDRPTYVPPDGMLGKFKLMRFKLSLALQISTIC